MVLRDLTKHDRRDIPLGPRVCEGEITVSDPRGIAERRIEISRDPRYRLYQFPRTNSAIACMRQRSGGKVRRVVFRKEHGDE